MDVSKFKDGRVHIKTGGVKVLNVIWATKRCLHAYTKKAQPYSLIESLLSFDTYILPLLSE